MFDIIRNRTKRFSPAVFVLRWISRINHSVDQRQVIAVRPSLADGIRNLIDYHIDTYLGRAAEKPEPHPHADHSRKRIDKFQQRTAIYPLKSDTNAPHHRVDQHVESFIVFVVVTVGYGSIMLVFVPRPNVFIHCRRPYF